jgi:hypothetical protein
MGSSKNNRQLQINSGFSVVLFQKHSQKESFGSVILAHFDQQAVVVSCGFTIALTAVNLQQK